MTPFTTDNIPGASSAHLEVYQRSQANDQDRYDWRLVGGNGEIVCSSLQGFTTRGDATRAAERAIDLMVLGPEVRQI